MDQGLRTDGQAHAHQIKSLDWASRKATLVERATDVAMQEVLMLPAQRARWLSGPHEPPPLHRRTVRAEAGRRTAGRPGLAERDQVQDTKILVKQLKERGFEVVTEHRTVSRTWGTFTVLEEGSRFKIKRIEVKASAALSLQLRHHRAKHWAVVGGNCCCTPTSPPTFRRATCTGWKTSVTVRPVIVGWWFAWRVRVPIDPSRRAKLEATVSEPKLSADAISHQGIHRYFRFCATLHLDR